MTSFEDGFGQEIDRGKANKFFDRYLKIKEDASTVLPDIFKDKPVARRYYCGRKEQDPIGEDWGYFFDMASLDRMMRKIKEFGGHGMIVFNGVRSAEDSPAGADEDGRPTLMLFPLKKLAALEGGFEVGDFGEEHPGTGGGSGSFVKNENGEYELPKRVTQLLPFIPNKP